MAHVSRKEYFIVFLVLGVLTGLEIGVAYLPKDMRTAMIVALIGLAVAKAAVVGLYYMHLKYETKIMKLTVAIPLATPAVYALVLISEAIARSTLAYWMS